MLNLLTDITQRNKEQMMNFSIEWPNHLRTFCAKKNHLAQNVRR